MKLRTILLMGVAVACGLLASFLTARYLNPPALQVLVAIKPIPRGAVVVDPEAMFELKEFPANTALPPNLATNHEQLRNKKDHLLKQAMNAGEPLTLDNVIDRKSGGLSWTLKPGYTALGVKATPESVFAGLLEPGNHVKVITLKKGEGEKKPVILMKNVRVLAVDSQTDKSQEKKNPLPTIITLEVNDIEAKKLRLAQEDGPLALGLMSEGNHDDREGEVETRQPPVDISSQKVKVLVAGKPIARGTPLKDCGPSFVIKEVPRLQLPVNYITDAEQLAGKMKDHFVIKPLKVDEPLSFDYLDVTQEERPVVEPETILTIQEGSQYRIYARNAAGRYRLIESSALGVIAPKDKN